MKLVRAIDVIDFSHKVGCREQFEQIYAAIDRLYRSSPDQGVKFHRKGLDGPIASKKAHVYARSFKMPVITRNSGEFMLICRRPDYKMKGEMEVRLFELAAQSKRKGTTEVPKSGALNQRGSGSCAPARI